MYVVFFFLFLFPSTHGETTCEPENILNARQVVFRDRAFIRCHGEGHSELCDWGFLRPSEVICTNEDAHGQTAEPGEIDHERILQRWRCRADGHSEEGSVDLHCSFSYRPACAIQPARDCFIFYNASEAVLHELGSFVAWMCLLCLCACSAFLAYYTHCCFLCQLRWPSRAERDSRWKQEAWEV